MFARVSTLQGSPERMEQGISEYRDQTVPAARQQKGFKGAYLLVDRKSGKALSVTLWETEEDLRASDALADRLRAQAAQTTVAASPAREVFEVAVEA